MHGQRGVPAPVTGNGTGMNGNSDVAARMRVGWRMSWQDMSRRNLPSRHRSNDHRRSRNRYHRVLTGGKTNGKCKTERAEKQ